MEQHVAVGLLHRVRDAAIAHAAAVDVEVLLIGARAVVHGLRDPAMQAQAGGFVVDAQGVFREFFAQGFEQAIGGREDAVAAIAPRGPPVVRDAQFDIRPRERERTQPFFDVAHISCVARMNFARAGTL